MLASRFFLCLFFAVVTCFFNRDPRSSSISARPHGRVDLVLNAMEVVLSVVYSLTSFCSAQVLLGACVMYSVTSVYLVLTYLPFYKLITNVVVAMHSCVFSSATVYMGIAMLRGRPEVRRASHSRCSFYFFEPNRHRLPLVFLPRPPPPPPLPPTAVQRRGDRIPVHSTASVRCSVRCCCLPLQPLRRPDAGHQSVHGGSTAE